MSDLYSELLVKKERTTKDRLVKGGVDRPDRAFCHWLAF